MTEVTVRDLTMRYGEQVVLSHFSHRFSAGGRPAVESTLLRALGRGLKGENAK